MRRSEDARADRYIRWARRTATRARTVRRPTSPLVGSDLDASRCSGVLSHEPIIAEASDPRVADVPGRRRYPGSVSDLIAYAAARYADENTSPFEDQVAAAAAWTQANAPAAGMMSGVAEARLLEALIVVGGARNVLEIGTFTGVGALAMAAAMPPDGHVTTLEVDADTATVARRHIDASPYADRVQLIVGDALQTLAGLEGPFDLVYIDAWKADYPAYYKAAMPKLTERGVLVADNLFRGGAALHEAATDESTVGIREFARAVQQDDRVHNVLLTVGDGVMLAWRRR
jgi:caffeoyl-CoA O-methyltransferase